MAIDIIARGLATSLIGADGKIDSAKMPVLNEVPEGTPFYPVGQLSDSRLVAGKTAEEILLMILYGVVSPTLTNPELSIALSADNQQLIIGRKSLIAGSLSFNRGKIDPAYGTSGYRSGAPISYTIGNLTVTSSNNSYDFQIELTPTLTTTSLIYGVTYGKGEQPVNSIGQNVDQPLEEGSIYHSIELNAAYALYDMNGKDILFQWFEDNDGQGYLSAFASEGAGNKQSFAISSKLNVVGIKAFNPMTQQWEWLGGSARASLTHFDATIINGESLNETEDYVLYTHNQPAKGERELRIYVI